MKRLDLPHELLLGAYRWIGGLLRQFQKGIWTQRDSAFSRAVTTRHGALCRMRVWGALEHWVLARV
jgi:hypothetical protein